MARNSTRIPKRKAPGHAVAPAGAAIRKAPFVPARAAPRLGAKRRSSGIAWPVIPAPQHALALAMQYQLEQSQWWPADKLLAHQLRQAQSLIEHAAATVPFYRDRLRPATGLPLGALTLERFRDIPLLSRRDVQEAGKAMASRTLPPGHGTPVPSRTSGSSGRPIEFLNTAVTALMAAAMTLRGHFWHKRELAQKNVSIRPPRLHMPVGRGLWSPPPWNGVSTLIDMRQPISRMFDRMIAEEPVYLQSHPYVILGLIQRSEDTGRRPDKLKEVRTYGETLAPWLRERCREVWGVPIADNYSAEEMGTIAHQCSGSTNLHVQAENVLVEVLDRDGAPCRPGQSGRVVVTALHNFATPFIREELGDIVTAGDPCDCGRGLPVLARILGRERNLVVLPSGEKLFPELYGEFGAVTAVRQYQLIQKTRERIEVRLAVARPLSAEEEATIRGFIRKMFGYAFELPFVYVDEIAREPSGKYQDFRSELPRADGA